MAQVKVHETGEASGEMPASAPQVVGVVSFTDSRGRVIEIKKLGPVERMRMFKIIGAEAARNEAYLSIAALAFLVVNIDGSAVSRPTSELQLEALVQRLGDDGLEGIAQAATEHFAPTGEIDRDAVKNS